MPGMVLKHKTKGNKQVKKLNSDGSLEIYGSNTSLATNDFFVVEITTTEPQEVVKRIKEAWKPILTTLQPVTELEWQPVLNLFEALDLPTLNPHDIKGTDLKRSITQMKTRSASGLDWWKVAELVLLTIGQFDMLAAFLKQCEKLRAMA